MKKSHLLIIVFAILFLFIIQSTGTLVESIYILDLMTSGLDAKALGVLFFFVPLLFLPFFKKGQPLLVWILFGLLFISRGLTPYLNTTDRLLASGIATAISFTMFFLLITNRPAFGRWAPSGLALAVALSTLLRTLGHGIEYSLTPAGGWVGWVLGLLLGLCLALSDLKPDPTVEQMGGKRTVPIFGSYLILTLVYFSISAPAVIARWTQGNYTLIVTAVSLFSLAWVWLSTHRSDLLERISPGLVVIWNLLFTLSLTLTLLLPEGLVPTHAKLSTGCGWRTHLPSNAALGSDAPALPGALPRPANLPSTHAPTWPGTPQPGAGHPAGKLHVDLVDLRQHLLQRLGLYQTYQPSLPQHFLAGLFYTACSHHPAGLALK